jgi:hypothetical protein
MPPPRASCQPPRENVIDEPLAGAGGLRSTDASWNIQMPQYSV